MARFSCSYVTNITTFQEPRRKKDGMNLKKNRKITTNALLLGDGLVSINGAAVASAVPRGPGLCLETDFNHICGLSKSNCHGACGTASQQPTADAHI
ncbi:hypothetical protein INR49_015643 [Caranx melampygus]|nr:hypothetical protein INR49_015643 [Caranx melampygus]